MVNSELPTMVNSRTGSLKAKERNAGYQYVHRLLKISAGLVSEIRAVVFWLAFVYLFVRLFVLLCFVWFGFVLLAVSAGLPMAKTQNLTQTLNTIELSTCI